MNWLLVICLSATCNTAWVIDTKDTEECEVKLKIFREAVIIPEEKIMWCEPKQKPNLILRVIGTPATGAQSGEAPYSTIKHG